MGVPQTRDAGVLRSDLTALQDFSCDDARQAQELVLASTKREVALLQGKQQVAKRDVPTLASQRTAEDNLWLALAGLTLAGRIHLLVLDVQPAQVQQGSKVKVVFKAVLRASFFSGPASDAAEGAQPDFDGQAQVLLYHLINSSIDGMGQQDICLEAKASPGHDAAPEADEHALSDEEEQKREEVAEDVQLERKERLRDDLLSMVCPTDWTIQAPEPPGLKLALHAYQRHALAWMTWRERIGTSSLPEAAFWPSSSAQDTIDAEAAAMFGVGVGSLHPCWQPVTLPSGLKVFENRYTGQVTQHPPAPPPSLPGGILGDEMGLGKTAEMHALMVARPRPRTSSCFTAKSDLSFPPAVSSSAPDAMQMPDTSHVLPANDACDGRHHDMNAERRASGNHASSSEPSIPHNKRQRTDAHDTDLKAADNPDGSGSGQVLNDRSAESPTAAGDNHGSMPKELVAGHNLVVCPAQLTDQWMNEVGEKHGNLKVVVYGGLRWHHKQAQKDAKKKQKPPPKKKNKAARMAWAQDQWEKLVQVSAGEADPSFDPQQEASDALKYLLEADVVLTSYDVLKQEVHYSPESERLHTLRRAKKYIVPESPLLSFSWWRVVLDEAQMVGTGLRSVAVMAGRLHSTHRWAVTGTPIGPGGLDDIQGLLKVLHHNPFCDPLKWKWCVANPYLTGEKGSAAQLARVLRPIMWRNSKRSSAGLGLELPPRTLTLTRLHFTPAEHTFYAHILDKTREARDALHSHRQATADGAGPSTESPQKSERRRSSAATQARKLFEGAEREVRQLRLACIHPQMTAYWRNLSAEMQLDSGGALSMSQIMQRLLEGVQAELQAEERDLCAHLNAQAHLLTLEAHLDCLEQDLAELEGPTDKGKGKQTSPPESPVISDSTMKGKRKLSAGSNSTSPASKKRRKNNSSPNAPTQEARAGLLAEALHLLQRSQAVGESGIEALNGEGGVQEIDNTIVGADATIKAWRFMQANTAHQLAEVYEALNNTMEASSMRKEVQAKVTDVREVADDNLAKAAAKSAQAQAKVEELKAQLLAHWQQADRQGWEGAHVGMHEWVQGLTGTFRGAQGEERAARHEHTFQGTGASQQTLMGTHVAKALQAVERQLVETRGGLEGLVGAAMSQQALHRLKALQNALSGAASAKQALGPAPFLQQLPDRALPWRALCNPDSPALMPSAAALQASQSGLLHTQVALRKTIKAIEKQLVKFQKQAQDWSEYSTVSGCSLQACSEGLAGVKGQLELVRALREVHIQEVRQELAQFEADSVEAEVMAAAQARTGEGPLRVAEGKDIKTLQTFVNNLMKSCENLRARKRFFANKVDEINNPRPPPSIPFQAVGPSNPEESPRAVANQPLEGIPENALMSHGVLHDSESLRPSPLPSHSRYLGPSPVPSLTHSEGTRMLDAWLTTPPSTPPTSRPPTASADPDTHRIVDSLAAEANAANDAATGKGADRLQDAAVASGAADTSTGTDRPTAGGESDAVTHSHTNGIIATSQSKGKEAAAFQSSTSAMGHVLEAQQAISRPASAHNQQTEHDALQKAFSCVEPDLPSRPASAQHSMTHKFKTQHAQQLARELDLSWADGVRAPVGVALAIGPWAHTSSALPVTTQAIQPESIDLTSSVVAHTVASLQSRDSDDENNKLDMPASWNAEGHAGATSTADTVSDTGHDRHHSMHDAAAAAAAAAADRVQTTAGGDAGMSAAGAASELTHDSASKEPAAEAAAPHAEATFTRETTPDDDSSPSQMCNVCLCPIRQVLMVLQPCGHYYCKNCTAAIQAAGYFARCPECRTRISSTFRVPLSSSQVQTHKEDAQHAQIRVVGNWMSKIEGLVRRIVRLRQTTPEEKSLVFSQYPDALKLVGKALSVNNIAWVELKGGSKASTAVRDFENKEEVRVFLLPHKVGASGLTLNRANHVFLLEPCLDSAILQQAVGRAHRMGQTRPVHVTRLIMHSSVEEAVMEAQERRQPLMDLVGPADDAEQGLAGQQVAKQETLGQQDLHHLLNAVLPAAQPLPA